MLQTLYDTLDRSVEKVVRWQREMTSRPALGPENGGTGEHEKAAWLLEELSGLGFTDILEHPCPDDRVPAGYRPNLSARLPGRSSRTLWIISHMDVVPTGESHLWRSSPFRLKVEGDLLYGRGVEDNQQAICSGLLAADALLHCGMVPDLSLGLIFVSDEETGMRHGLTHILKTAPDRVGPDDLCIVPDMGNARGSMVEVVEKSILWLRFTVNGQQCHASRPQDGKNSLVAASACILALDRLHTIFDRKNPVFSPDSSTFVPSKKEANVENINTLPGKDVFHLDCRVIPEYPLEAVIQECRNIADEISSAYGVTIDLEPVNMAQAPAATPAEAEVVVRLLSALRELRAVEGVLRGAGGLTEASCLRASNRQAVAWATLLGTAHSINEHSSIPNTIADAKVFVRMLFD